MKIECPYCQTKTKIDYAEHICCERCHRSLKDYDYEPKRSSLLSNKATIVGVSLLASGIAAGYLIEDALDQKRYSPLFEHSIIMECAGSDERIYRRRDELQADIRRCACALERSIKEVGYRYEIDEALIVSFTKHLENCR